MNCSQVKYYIYCQNRDLNSNTKAGYSAGHKHNVFIEGTYYYYIVCGNFSSEH